MATQVPSGLTTKLAAASYASGQYRACVLDSNGQAAVPAAGARVYGIVQNKPTIGQAAAIACRGKAKWEASAAIAAGANVSTANDGRARTAVTGDVIAGIAENAAAGAGIYIEVNLDASRGSVV